MNTTSALRLSRGKVRGIDACANDCGIISALAMDQRDSLQRAIGNARRSTNGVVPDDLSAFKSAVVRVLSSHASAVLLDPEYGLPAASQRAPHAGLLLAYERSGFDAAQPGRLPHLLSEWSTRRLSEAGADAIKVLLYYNAFDEQRINSIKHALIERVGAECVALDVPFFLEIVTYDDATGEQSGLAFAKAKPRQVTAAIEEFSKPRYGIDVLKVEIPVNMRFVAGTQANAGGETAYTHGEALEAFRTAAQAAAKPFIYLSGGVTHEIFCESLELAIEAGSGFAGVLCGRATWQDGIAVFGAEGLPALKRWLEDRGIRNIETLNTLLAKGAKPWWSIYGGHARVNAATNTAR